VTAGLLDDPSNTSVCIYGAMKKHGHPKAAMFLVTHRQPSSLRGWTARLAYWQVGNLNDPMRVFQLNEPVFFRYSVVYQNVQSSTGSTVMAL
jgi:hypothetical protein